MSRDLQTGKYTVLLVYSSLPFKNVLQLKKNNSKLQLSIEYIQTENKRFHFFAKDLSMRSTTDFEMLYL